MRDWYVNWVSGEQLVLVLGAIGAGHDEMCVGAALGLEFGDYEVAGSSVEFGYRSPEGVTYPANADYVPYTGKPGAMRATVVCTTTNSGSRTLVVHAGNCGDPELEGMLVRMSLDLLLIGIAGMMPS